MPSISASASIVVTPGVATSLGASSRSGNSAARGMPRATSRSAAKSPFSQVTSVFSPEPDGRQEVEGLLSAHHPGLRLDGRVLETCPLEHPVVGPFVLAVRDVEPRLVAVERVRVLHDELAQPQKASARPRLVTLLDREVVEELRQLPIARDLLRMERHGLLVGQRQHVLAAVSVLEAEDLGDRVAARLLPELVGREHGHQHLLAADRVHLLTDDLHHLLVDAPAEREERPHARRDLADVPAANEELVRGRLGIGRRLAQGRDEEL